jgi:hypothetical protein
MKSQFNFEDPEVWLVKTNQVGDTLWTKTLFGYEGTAVFQTSEGGYVIGTRKVRIEEWDAVYDIGLIKTNSFGDTLWTKTYFLDGNTEGGAGVCNIIETNEGEYILGGTMNETRAGENAFLIKTDSLGDTLWTKQFLDTDCSVGAVRETSDGGYIIAGESEYDTQKSGAWLYKSDSSGKKLWENIILEGAAVTSIQEILNGDYICSVNKWIESSWFPDTWIIRTDQNGDTLWTKFLIENAERVSDIKLTSDGGFIILSAKESYMGRLHLIKTAPCLTGFGNSFNTLLPQIYTLHQNYPNPFNPSTTIEFDLPNASDVRIEVYNIAGQKIQTLLINQISAGSHQVEFNAQNLSSGVYFYKIEAGEFQDVKKMILLR